MEKGHKHLWETGGKWYRSRNQRRMVKHVDGKTSKKWLKGRYRLGCEQLETMVY